MLDPLRAVLLPLHLCVSVADKRVSLAVSWPNACRTAGLITRWSHCDVHGRLKWCEGALAMRATVLAVVSSHAVRFMASLSVRRTSQSVHGYWALIIRWAIIMMHSLWGVG